MGSNHGREFEIGQQVAELLDSLQPEQQIQIMALLATRYGLKLIPQNTYAGTRAGKSKLKRRQQNF